MIVEVMRVKQPTFKAFRKLDRKCLEFIGRHKDCKVKSVRYSPHKNDTRFIVSYVK